MTLRNSHKPLWFAAALLVALGGQGCKASSSPGESSGGSPSSGGAPGAGGSGAGKSGGSPATGGATGGGAGAASGGTSNAAGGTAGGTHGGNGGAAGGGAGGTQGGAGGSAAGGGGSGGSTSHAGGTSGSGAGGSTASTGTGVSYMLPPPDQCHDLDYIPGDSYAKTGCIAGNTSSQCGGKCQTLSACEDPSSKPGADPEFMCPRNLLFSPEMEQAVKDDGLDGFHYAVVGHDPDQGGIDGNSHSCCQCYQLVYAYPSPSNDREALTNPDNPNPPTSAIPIPPPLIVQSFNTAATATTFDVYMPAGGMGANNGCYPLSPDSSGRKYMYTGYPLDGQPGNGGVKPASLYQECKTSVNWVTQATLSSSACVQRTTTACNKITSNIPGLTAEGSTNCLKANTIDTFYHLNWAVYAMRVECPEHLTRVTGCRLAPQSGVKAVKPSVKTAAQAAQDPDFWSKTAHTNNLYETTTMEDCCRPTCASYSQISGFGLVTDPQYRSFYNCDANGVPWTQPQ